MKLILGSKKKVLYGWPEIMDQRELIARDGNCVAIEWRSAAKSVYRRMTVEKMEVGG